ncbi:MAG: hypothetical protein GWO20_16990 [Candidatus Korarchaeota archaeon]|nr:hypothetical protein [Candidatus Korarchaeota archaeon]NIW15096.1 hypothetical protein [Candidatus Thorarchaeota archaeon]
MTNEEGKWDYVKEYKEIYIWVTSDAEEWEEHTYQAGSLCDDGIYRPYEMEADWDALPDDLMVTIVCTMVRDIDGGYTDYRYGYNGNEVVRVVLDPWIFGKEIVEEVEEEWKRETVRDVRNGCYPHLDKDVEEKEIWKRVWKEIEITLKMRKDVLDILRKLEKHYNFCEVFKYNREALESGEFTASDLKFCLPFVDVVR